jgi:tRNA pseudouridine55 synthase
VGESPAAPSGLLIVDKPSGWTSHDVVARVRRLAGTRKVGHAGTLDPMATGVLVLGLGRATRLLGYVSGADKTYEATVRFGETTNTDDAEGEVTSKVDARDLDLERVRTAARGFVGDLEQVPSSVSAIKVSGERAYTKVRRGEEVELAARPVTVSQFELGGTSRPSPDVLDVDIAVTCSSGTYIRALARDLGRALEVGGHLTALRRTRVGGFELSAARTLAQLEKDFTFTDLTNAVELTFPRRDVSAEETVDVRVGRPLSLQGEDGPVGVFAPDGSVLAVMAPRDGQLRVAVGLTG